MFFPKPQQLTALNGSYTLKNGYAVDDTLALYDLIKNGNEDISVTRLSNLGKEEYHLDIMPDGIVITASCDEGIYRATSSLLQLLRKYNSVLPCMKVIDYPQFPNRGYMMDISRGRKPKVETIKQWIDFLSGLKYNQLQLYMEGECFKYSAYPKYTADFDCLTPNDIKELNAYCKERFIDLVPNQNSFGHLSTWLKHDEFKHLALCEEDENGSTLNPLLPESYEFVSNLYESLLPNFDSEYVNIGLDEAYGLGKYQSESYCNEHGKDALFMEWLNKLSKLAKEKYGKKVMFWSDMIYKFEKLYHQIPKDAVAMEWGYELIQSQVMTEHCITFQNHGLNYYVCPSCNTHMSLTGRFDVTSFNIRTSAEIGAKYGASGYLLTDWGNGPGHPHFLVWSLLPTALAGQYGWNVGKEQDGESFKANFIHASEDYVNEVIFGGVKVARLLYRMANYYLLEPERVHVGTMCGQLLRFPLSETKYAYFYDLKDCGDAFYFNNVTAYVKNVLADIEKLDFDEQLKREIRINSNMVIFSSELCKLRIGETMFDEELDRLIQMAADISKEYRELYLKRNYENGVEIDLKYLDERCAELKKLKTCL